MDKSNLWFSILTILFMSYVIVRIYESNHIAFGLVITLVRFGVIMGAAYSLIIVSWRMSPKQVLKKGLPHY